jgi:hypothetical protein
VHYAYHTQSIYRRQASFACQFSSSVPTIDVVLARHTCVEDNVMTFNWADHTEAVAGDILGKPNSAMSRPPEDVRFGQHGSVSLNYNTGQWFDFENNRCGGVRELIRVYKDIEDRDTAIAYIFFYFGNDVAKFEGAFATIGSVVVTHGIGHCLKRSQEAVAP